MTTLHRVNGMDAMVAVLKAGNQVRGGYMHWLKGAPTHVLAELLTELERDGFYLGVEDRSPASMDAGMTKPEARRAT